MHKLINNISKIASNIHLAIFPLKHDYDLDNPIIDEITITQEYKLSNQKTVQKLIVTGFQCKKCGKTLWLDKRDMTQLPRSMKYGCK